jgi:ankyrin repeat protein
MRRFYVAALSAIVVLLVGGTIIRASARRNADDRLITAIIAANQKEVSEALDAGGNPNAIYKSDKSGRKYTFQPTALQVLVGWRNPEQLSFQPVKENLNIAKLLIQHGADINVQDKNGMTPLLICAWSNQHEVFKILVETGADLNAKDRSGSTALSLSLTQSAANNLDILLRHGDSPNQQFSDGTTPLMVACRECNPAGVELLLAHGADITARDSAGRDAIAYNEDAAKALRTAISEAQHEGEGYTTPVAIARMQQRITSVRHMLNAAKAKHR